MKIHPGALFGALYVGFLILVAKLLQWDGLRIQRKAGEPASSPRIDGSEPDDPSWLHWHAGDFRFGLSRILLVLAGYILAVTLYRHHNPYELIPLVFLGLVIVVLALPQRPAKD
jgi:hypothetical protein